MLHASDDHQEIREAIRALCGGFPPEYFREVDEQRGYPEKFVDALTKAGWLAALIPQEYGGSGLGLTEASVIMEEINRAGGNSGACHGQMYNMGTLLRNGSAAQKATYLPKIASVELRLQAMAVTEPTTGTDTTKLKTTAIRKGDRYVVNGQKVWISRVQHSDLMILLARTTPLSETKKKSEGLSTFLVDLREAVGRGLTVRPIANMVNHETNELFFDNLEIPVENLIGEEGRGFRYILDGLNAERTLIAAECIGDGYWFIDKVTKYANERVVFGRPDRTEPGRAVPDRPGLCGRRGGESDALQGLRAVRRAQALRCRGEHGEDARSRCIMGGRGTSAFSSTAATVSPPNTTWSASSARRACIRSHRSRPDSDSRARRGARAGPAAVVLSPAMQKASERLVLYGIASWRLLHRIGFGRAARGGPSPPAEKSTKQRASCAALCISGPFESAAKHGNPPCAPSPFD